MKDGEAEKGARGWLGPSPGPRVRAWINNIPVRCALARLGKAAEKRRRSIACAHTEQC